MATAAKYTKLNKGNLISQIGKVADVVAHDYIFLEIIIHKHEDCLEIFFFFSVLVLIEKPKVRQVERRATCNLTTTSLQKGGHDYHDAAVLSRTECLSR